MLVSQDSVYVQGDAFRYTQHTALNIVDALQNFRE